MPRARDEAGNIWELDAQGNPVRLLQPAMGGPQAVTLGTPDPTIAADERRKDVRVNLAERAAGLSAEANKRAAEAAAFDRRKFEMTHNPDGTPKVGLSPVLIGKAKNKLNSLAAIRQQVERIKELEGELKQDGWEGPVWGNVPFAGKIDPESSRYDKALTLLTAQIRQLTRTEGEGAMSDYESRLAAAIPPSRTDSREARAEALRGIEKLVNITESGYGQLLGGGVADDGDDDDALISKYLD